MPKNLLQDMIKIKNPEVVRKVNHQIVDYEKRSVEKPAQRYDRQIKKRSKYGLWIVSIVPILFFIFAISFLFSKAEVIVNPKSEDITLDKNFSAVKNSSVDGLSFDLVIISGEENKEILATEEKELSVKAKGTVLIYNDFSTAPQKLLIDTRLESSNGKIYKTVKAVTVPGVNADGKPGSVEVDIYGDVAGKEYNSAPLDFKIFGFKGTPKYDKFYARSKGEIAGGFKGMSPVIADAEKASIVNELKNNLKSKLLGKATEQIPSGFVLFKDAVFLKIDEENASLVSGGQNSVLKLKGTLYGFLFNEQDLTKKIAEASISKNTKEEIYISNIEDLTFSMSDPQSSFSEIKNIDFTLSGTAKAVWKFDSNDLILELKGKPKKDFNQILSQYPNVDSAKLQLSPFWISSIPDKQKRINIIVNYPK